MFFPPTRHENLCRDLSPVEYPENGLTWIYWNLMELGITSELEKQWSYAGIRILAEKAQICISKYTNPVSRQELLHAKVNGPS